MLTPETGNQSHEKPGGINEGRMTVPQYYNVSYELPHPSSLQDMQNTGTALPSCHPEWLAFLENQDGVAADGLIGHFGQGPRAEIQAASNGNIIADLSDLALIAASGADTETFLQSQLSNDIRLISERRAQYSAYCNPKGRMFSIFLVIRHNDSVWLQLPVSLAQPTINRLRMFILRSKVRLEFADPSLVRTGISGPDSESLISKIFPEVPANDLDCVSQAEATAIRLPGKFPRFEILAGINFMKKFWEQAVSAGMTPCGHGAWGWLDIMAAVPVIKPGTVEEFVPQMTNLELINGVSFNKGCYPGQEIVARMHYLGRLKQRMIIAHVTTDGPPAPGAPVYSPEYPDQSAGSVVDAQPSPTGGFDALVVAQIQSIKNNSLYLNQANGPRLELLPLPYPLPVE